MIDPDSNTPSIRRSDHITGKEVHGLEIGIQKPSSRKAGSGGTPSAAQWKESPHIGHNRPAAQQGHIKGWGAYTP